MKNKIPENSIFRKKGFFAALYSCVGVVLVLAAIISYNNIRSVTSPPDSGSQILSEAPGAQQDESAPVNEGITPPLPQQPNYGANVGQDTAQGNPGTAQGNLGTAQGNPGPAQSNPGADSYAADIGQAVSTQMPDILGNLVAGAIAPPASSAAPGELSASAGASAAPAGALTDNEPIESVENDVSSAADSGQASVDTADSGPLFASFSDDQKMSWPVLGDIVMDYSVDHVIYDKTLDQYRTNDNICIAAEAGAQVKAAAAGVVTAVTQDRQSGNVVVIDDGNGWVTTYGQLMDGVLVKAGDVVKAGQVIGGVASPTNYGVLLGNHLTFKVTKDDAPVNPLDVLVAETGN
ncbi:MAG: M23 family metallopeptidase [Firmicutes bacterium]|nr:M23 family metallopeptidase [Bacillota bacterium]